MEMCYINLMKATNGLVILKPFILRLFIMSYIQLSIAIILKVYIPYMLENSGSDLVSFTYGYFNLYILVIFCLFVFFVIDKMLVFKK